MRMNQYGLKTKKKYSVVHFDFYDKALSFFVQ